MTTASPTRWAGPSPSTARRTLDVVRLQFINRQTFLWIPLIVLLGAWLLNLLVYLIVAANGGSGPMYSGASQAPVWYFAVIGGQAMTLTFPFSQAMSLTRREFFVGTLAAAAVSALGLTAVFVALGLLERATDGYGMDGYFAYLPALWTQGTLGAGLAYFTLTMLFFVIGFWFMTVVRRFGPMVAAAVAIGVALIGVGLIALVTAAQAWGAVARWFVEAGPVGVSVCGLLLAAVLAVGSSLTLRRMSV
ncbi:hypothetical protein [Brachybacterium sp. YJGR34]|uniref:hypothetical protein n=1 Tax=Brachybacterium sp. YJGR34 TaxID=2059911 RepID=UPI000E0BA3C2|nr:hypothetical protein [Brachybacterium sp. YJGR34]